MRLSKIIMINDGIKTESQSQKYMPILSLSTLLASIFFDDPLGGATSVPYHPD